jgi:hypothetical protein
MIYRILAATQLDQWDQRRGTWVTVPGPLQGGFMAGLGGFNLDMPEIKNPRTRFYFTEKGWHELGKAIVAQARRDGVHLRILRRKNPRPSQIIFEDDLQIAILPQKDLPRRRRK